MLPVFFLFLAKLAISCKIHQTLILIVITCFVPDLHFACGGADRQRVRLATQLFSEQVNLALKTCFPHDKKALALADFILKLDQGFDTLNSRQRLDVKQARCGLGIGGYDLEEGLAGIKNLCHASLD